MLIIMTENNGVKYEKAAAKTTLPLRIATSQNE
jgi:hypothetical protein